MLRPMLLSLAFVSAPAFAQAYYQAETAAPSAKARFVARDNVWHCNGNGCASTRTGSRPAIVCSSLVREVGALTRFSVDGRAFGPEELESCNRRAR